MGCIFGLAAAVTGLAGAYFAAEFVSGWAGLVVLLVAIVGFAIPVVRHGHRQFGGGGNTDLMLYIAVLGVLVVLAVPRYNRSAACAAREEYGAWIQAAQEAYHAQNGRYASEMTDLAGLPVGAVVPPDDGIRISLEGPDATTFVATVAHHSCPGDPLRLGGSAPATDSTTDTP